MTAKHSPPCRRARLLSPTLSRWAISAALLLSAGAASAIPPTLYVATTGSDSNTGTSQSSPFLTIQAAINASNNAATIEIADGTYTGPGNVDLDTLGTNLTIHGAASTIIDCGGSSSTSHRGFFIHSGESVSISGLTIENGYENYGGVSDAGYGGGVYSNTGSLTLNNCKLIHNTSQNNGGGIFSDDASLTLQSCTVDGNTSSNGNGGGVAYYSTQTSSGIADLENCIITNNFSQYSGGGIYSYATGSGTVTFANCLITNNAAYYDGGGLYNIDDQGGTTTVTNCTLTANMVRIGDGSGVYSYDNGGASSYMNTIVYGNNGSSSQIFGPNSAAITYSDVQGGYPGTGNIDRDPLFVGSGDFHLLTSSLCLGAGTSTGAPSTDIEGTARPTTPSIGAYEIGVPHIVRVPSAWAPVSVSVGANNSTHVL